MCRKAPRIFRSRMPPTNSQAVAALTRTPIAAMPITTGASIGSGDRRRKTASQASDPMATSSKPALMKPERMEPRLQP